MATVLWWFLVAVLAIWLIGFTADFAGGLIHMLLVVAVLILIYNLVTGRRAV